MTVPIKKKIVGFNIIKDEANEQKKTTKNQNLERMSERVKRPESLEGETYKIKPPHSEHALYVTINDIVLNKGTDHESRRPFEIFLSSKNMEHFQWTIALTLIISAIFRKGGDITFLVEELRSVFDPNGGYFKRGGKYVPSLVAEIADVVERHLKKIGMLPDEELSAEQQAFIQTKKEAIAEKNATNDLQTNFPPEAQLCSKCSTKAMMMMDGCLTCLNCGYSKCG